MAQEVSLFSPQNVPAHIREFLDKEKNIDEIDRIPSLSPEGKTWTISIGGQKTKLMGRNDEGDEIPVPIFRAVVLNYAKKRGRAIYLNQDGTTATYNAAKPGKPTCWSDDGVKAGVNEPNVAITDWTGYCDTCPKSKKGSKMQDGVAKVACQQHLMLALIPATQKVIKLDFEPLRLKLAITSIWDGESPDQEAEGWYAWDNYIKYLRANNTFHTGALVTKMKFDPDVQYPKILFATDRWVPQEELQTIADLAKNESVTSLLGGRWTPAGVDGEKIEGPKEPKGPSAEEIEAQQKAQAMATQAKAAAEAAEQEKAAAAKKAAAAAKKAAEDTKKAAAPSVSEDDDGGLSAIGKPNGATAPAAGPKPGRETPKKTEAAPATPSNVPDNVAGLLDDWQN